MLHVQTLDQREAWVRLEHVRAVVSTSDNGRPTLTVFLEGLSGPIWLADTPDNRTNLQIHSTTGREH